MSDKEDAQRELEQLHAAMEKLEANSRKLAFSPTDIRRLSMEALDGIEAIYQKRGRPGRMLTGFRGIDELTGGLHPGEMFVIASRPAMGKTALAMNIAEHVAVNGGNAVAIYSLDMSAGQLVQRLLCSMAGTDLRSIRNGCVGRPELGDLIHAATKLSESRMHIDDTSGLRVPELCTRVRELKKREDIKLVVIDYLQKLRCFASPRGEGEEAASRGVADLKALARELSVALLVVAQLNRQPEYRDAGWPKLHDIRDVTAIEQEADVVGLLWREEYYRDDDDETVSDRAELIIAKHRHGPFGSVLLTFLKQAARFKDFEPTD